MNTITRIGGYETLNSAPASLHADVVTRLRDYLVEGHLLPGARIPERELCERFEISRTPLREALKVVAAEGLIELLPHRGARVRQFTEVDIRNLFEVIAGYDFVAGRLACARITDDGISAIERLHLEMYAAYLRRELTDYFRLNQMIHLAIVDAAANPVLSANYASANAAIRRLRFSANLLNRDRLSDAMREHEGMIDALRRRAGEELGLLMYAHMQTKRDAVCEFMREQADAS
ncbi:MAG: GntR family transcriptional regulator [Tardiphaga sp.]|nr:GntR family transcriptional regulator [Tardiphaga sp.]MDB5629411.1 GntR family transcriptional regulator [Tardiphaga sp.]